MKTMKVLLIEDKLTVSHYTWRDDNNILITAVDKNNNKTYYIIYDIEKMSKMILSNRFLNKDGHPSFSKDKKFIISDTYPDINNNQDYYKGIK